jgi:branched-chain amino acid transport system ATP-binding protein
MTATVDPDDLELELSNLSVIFGGLRAVSNVSLQVRRGERIGLIGPNGAGKTTLFNMICGAVRPTTGRIVLRGTEITRLGERRRARVGIGRTFQITELLGGLSCYENLLLSATRGTAPKFRTSLSTESVDEAIRTVVEKFGLQDFLDRTVKSLGYGEQRRLELAVALLCGSHLLLLDEPAAGLGAADRLALQDAILSIPREITVILVEHDLDLTLGVVDRVVCLDNGVVVRELLPKDVRGDDVIRRIYLGEFDALSYRESAE